jgi:hypothetical protein
MPVTEAEAASKTCSFEHESDLLQARAPDNLSSRIADDRDGIVCVV